MMIRIRECELVYRTSNVDAPSHRVSSSDDVPRLVPELVNRVHESMVVLMLDTRRTLIAKHEASRGNIDSCPVTPVTVFRAAVVAGATAVIIVHNHPSGSPEPSAEDVHLTTQLCIAGELLGVTVLDHVIVATGGHFSFADAGLMNRA